MPWMRPSRDVVITVTPLTKVRMIERKCCASIMRLNGDATPSPPGKEVTATAAPPWVLAASDCLASIMACVPSLLLLFVRKRERAIASPVGDERSVRLAARAVLDASDDDLGVLVDKDRAGAALERKHGIGEHGRACLEVRPLPDGESVRAGQAAPAPEHLGDL